MEMSSSDRENAEQIVPPITRHVKLIPHPPLTSCTLFLLLKYIHLKLCKQHRSVSDAELLGVWYGSKLFDTQTTFSDETEQIQRNFTPAQSRNSTDVNYRGKKSSLRLYQDGNGIDHVNFNKLYIMMTLMLAGLHLLKFYFFSQVANRSRPTYTGSSKR